MLWGNACQRSPSMLDQLKLSGSGASSGGHSSDGPELGSLPTSDLMVQGTGCLTPPHYEHPKPRTSGRLGRKTLRQSTPASLRANRRQPCRTRLMSSRPSTQTTLSSATALQASTSAGKASFRFFNSRLRDVYESCALPTETACAASHTILSSTYSQQTVRKSAWSQTLRAPPPLSVNLPKTSYLSSPFSALASMEQGEDAPSSDESAPSKRRRLSMTPHPPAPLPELTKRKMGQRKTPFSGQPRTCALLMLPNAAQKVQLKRAFAAKRNAYNWANSRVRNESAQPNSIQLQKEWSALKTKPPWLLTVSTQFQREGIKQLCFAYASNIAKRRKGKTCLSHFKVRYQSHYNKTTTPTEVLVVPKDQGEKKSSILSRFEPLDDLSTARRNQRVCCLVFLGMNLSDTGGIRLQGKPEAIGRALNEGKLLKETAKIHWDKRTDTFHFIHTYDSPPTFGPLNETERIVSLDPGTRPFQAWYSPTSGEHGELLAADRKILYNKCKTIDRLQSRLSKRLKSTRRTSGQHRNTTRQLKRKLARERRRVHNWVKGAHYDAANFLLERHDLILAPALEVKKLTDTHLRNIHSETARAMYTWSHYLFRQRLKSAAHRYPGRRVVELITERDKAGRIIKPAEPGTSKTCGLCGHWHASLGSSMRFVCPNCGVAIDRQLNGARNNFLAAYGRAVGVLATV